MFRPQRTMVLFAIVAEPAEKPDARLLALDFNSLPTLVSQCISRDRSDADNRASLAEQCFTQGPRKPVMSDHVKLRYAAYRQ